MMNSPGKKQKTVVRVRILGEEYSLRTDASAQHTKEVAEHVDATIRSAMAGGSIVESHRAAVLAALQITDELFTERAASESIANDLRGLAAEILPLLPPAERSSDD